MIDSVNGKVGLDSKQYKTKVEYAVSAVTFLIGIFFIFQALTIETTREIVGPRTLPMMLAVAITLGSVWLALRAYGNRAGDLKDGYGFLESDVPRILMVVGCGIIFVLTFFAFGYFTALLITFLAMLYAFGNRSWLRMIISSIFLAIIFQWLFMGIMLLNDPKGNIFDVRPFTNWITGTK